MEAALLQLDEAIRVLGWVLLHFLWQGGLIGVVYGGLRHLLQPGQQRHSLALLAFFALAASPLLTTAYLLAVPAQAMATLTSATIADSVAATAGDSPIGLQWDLFLPWLVGSWGIGVAVLTARALMHWRQLSQMMRRATVLAGWQSRFAAICERFGVRRAVRLLWSDEVQTPTLIGWIKPVILLPAAVALGFPVAQIELILAHELGHLRRWDHVVNLFQVVVETMLFYHPVVHWISRELRNEREICCDELVLQRGAGDAREYMRTLADLEELRLHNHGALALTATGGVLLERVQRIAGIPAAAMTARASGRLLPLLIGGVALLCISALQQSRIAQMALAELLSPRQLRSLLEPMLVVPSTGGLAVADLKPGRPSPGLPRLQLAASGAVGAVVPVAASAISLSPPVPLPVAEAPVSPTDAVATAVESDLRVPASSAVPASAAPPVVESKPATATSELVALRTAQPVYPQSALERGTQGRVQLSFSVDSGGSVYDITVDSASPAKVFDNAAVLALRRWRFDPASLSSAWGTRYTRSFVFALGESQRSTDRLAEGLECRQVTGTRICRRAGEMTESAISAR